MPEDPLAGTNLIKKSMIKTLQSLYEYFFAPWEITIYSEGTDTFASYCPISGVRIGGQYEKTFIKYKYSHKFRKEEKIVKEYLD